MKTSLRNVNTCFLAFDIIFLKLVYCFHLQILFTSIKEDSNSLIFLSNETDHSKGTEPKPEKQNADPDLQNNRLIKQSRSQLKTNQSYELPTRV